MPAHLKVFSGIFSPLTGVRSTVEWRTLKRYFPGHCSEFQATDTQLLPTTIQTEK